MAIKSARGYDTTDDDDHEGTGIPQGTDSFSFSNVSFVVGSGKKILQDVCGRAKSGQMIALMGPSGSGKTTLLNILARREAGSQVSGEMLHNNSILDATDFRQISTFVEQEDALIGSLTVYESVRYAAEFSLTQVTSTLRNQNVEETIQQFGLGDAKFTRIGTPLQKGCSGGQKRRVSVAGQLITLPKLVFLDEPTSGLDSAASFEICSRIRKLAQLNNLIVIASIHQPSSSTFNLFDQVLLLSKGAQLYYGPVTEIGSYFEHTSFPLLSNYNAADHLLDISNVDFYDDPTAGTNHIKALTDHWQNSDAKARLTDDLKSRSTEKNQYSGRMAHSGKAKLPTQISILLKRSAKKAIRDPLAYGVRLIMYLGLAIMMGTVWLRLSAVQGHINEFITALFFGSAFMSFMAVAYIPAFLEDYASYAKERRNGLYGPAAFIIANTLIGIPFLYLISITFSIVTYFMVNFRHSTTGFFNYTLWLFLDLLAAESLVVLISVLVPLFVAALALTAFANGLWMSVGGFLVSENTLNVFWYYTFFQIDYQRYVFDALMRNEFLFRSYDCAADCSCLYPSELTSQCMIQGGAVLRQYGLSGSFNPGVYVAILLAITIFMRLATYGILLMKK